jgi:hypothetical protein
MAALMFSWPEAVAGTAASVVGVPPASGTFIKAPVPSLNTVVQQALVLSTAMPRGELPPEATVVTAPPPNGPFITAPVPSLNTVVQ